MKRRIFCVMLLFSFVAAFAEDSTETLLKQLDGEVAKSNIYLQRKENECARLKGNLRLAVTPIDRYLSCAQVAEAYSHFKSDSALVYLHRCRHIGETTHNSVWVMESTIAEAQVLANRGDNYISMSRLNHLGSIDDVYAPLRAKYAMAVMSNYVRSTTNISKEFNAQRAAQLWQKYSKYIPQNSIDYLIYEMIANRKYNPLEMIARLEKVYKTQKGLSYDRAACHLQLYFAYDRAGKKESAFQEIILAEMDNLRLCNQSSPAMTRLLENMVKENNETNNHRIASYLQVCINEIRNFRDVGRSIHVVELQNEFLQYQKSSDSRRQNWLLSSLIVAVLLLSGGVVVLRQQYRKSNKLQSANVQLENKIEEFMASEKQHTLNKTLDGERIKTEEERNEKLNAIMARLYHLLGMAMGDMRQTKKEIANLITSGQLPKAAKMAKNAVLRDDTTKIVLENFDRDFLAIYPQFPLHLNRLLKSDAQQKAEKKGALTPEQRIMALIGLGLDDSSSIAEVLHYSVQTVYNYRMKMRHAALPDVKIDTAVKKLLQGDTALQTI